MQSLGRVGRILSGSLDPASMNASRDSQQAQKESQSSRQSESPSSTIAESPSSNALQAVTGPQKADDNQSQNSNYSLTMNSHTILQEPDVIASTKLAHSKTTDSVSDTRMVEGHLSYDKSLSHFRLLQLALEFRLRRHAKSATRAEKYRPHRSIKQQSVRRS